MFIQKTLVNEKGDSSQYSDIYADIVPYCLKFIMVRHTILSTYITILKISVLKMVCSSEAPCTCYYFLILSDPLNKSWIRHYKYSVTVALNHKKLVGDPKRMTKFKPSIDKYNLEEINYPWEIDYWKKFRKTSTNCS